MAVLPVSGVNFNSRNINFGNRYHEEDAPVERHSRGEAGKYATAPVIVLMAMNPSLLNSNAATLQEQEITPNVIEAEAPEFEQEADEATYVMAPELQGVQQSKPTYGWGFLVTRNVLLVKPALVNGKKSRLFFTNTGGTDPKKVNEVFLAKDGTGSKDLDHPPEVRTLIYHNIGEDKEFCGAIVRYQYKDKNGKEHVASKEVRLDDDTANEILALIYGKGKFVNKAFIELNEVKTANLIPVRQLY